MKSTLYLKFIVIYIIFGFLSFFTVGILSSQLVLDRLEKNDSQNLYRQANLVASDYLPPTSPETPPHMRYIRS